MTAQADTKADGILESRDDGKSVVRFERRLPHSVEAVWEALTRPDELIKWWGDADVELVEGGRFTMRWLNTDDEGNRAVMHATVTRLESQRLLELDGDIHGILLWTLQPDGEGTILTFSSTLDLPDEFRTKVIAGWHYHLDALAEALDGGRPDLVELPGWEAIHERYVAVLGRGSGAR
jgi:uncharacterized protein YndB with AHSA1/START domain